MKKLRLYICLIVTGLIYSCAPTKVAVTFEEPIIRVCEASGNQEQLYVKANRWMISIFKDARSIIQFSDKAEGILMGKYLLAESPNPERSIEQPIYAIIEISVRDGRARISITPDNYYYFKGKEYINNGDDLYSRGQGVNSNIYSKDQALRDIGAMLESFDRALQTKEIEF